MIKILIFLFTLSISSQIFGQEVFYQARSPRALLMGDAFTATANDEYTLFYNPAGLARNKGVEISFLNPKLGATNALEEVDRFKDFPSDDPAAITNRLVGFPIYLEAGAHPGLKMGNFGFNLYANSKTSVVLRNSTHPFLDIDYRYDRGFNMGYALSFGTPVKKKKGSKISTPGRMTSIGLGFKYINREGLDSTFDLYSTRILNDLRSVEEASDVKNILGYVKGSAVGFDAGTQYIMSTGSSEFAVGGSILNIGGMNYKSKGGENPVPNDEMIVNTGVSWKQDFGLLEYQLHFDLHPLNYDIDFGRKIHLGGMVGFPILDFYFGYNSGYASYGVGIDVWFFKILAGFYGVELGRNYKQEEGKRAVIYFNLLDVGLEL